MTPDLHESRLGPQPKCLPCAFCLGVHGLSLACTLASEGSRARFILEWDSLGAEGGGSFVTMETDQAEVGKCAQNSQRARGVPGLCVTE